MILEELASRNQTIYGEQYKVIAEMPIKDVKNAQPWFSRAESAEITEHEFTWGTGVSMCFHIKGGGEHYEILSKKSALKVGDKVNLDTVVLQAIQRTGEEPKPRVDGEAL